MVGGGRMRHLIPPILRSSLVAVAALMLGCATAGERPRARSAARAPRRAASRESPACQRARLAILHQLRRSQQRPCASDADCATVINPGSPVREYRRVAHAADAARIERAARAHLDRCGAFHHHEPIDAIRVVAARCVRGRCRERTTVMHAEPVSLRCP